MKKLKHNKDYWQFHLTRSVDVIEIWDIISPYYGQCLENTINWHEKCPLRNSRFFRKTTYNATLGTVSIVMAYYIQKCLLFEDCVRSQNRFFMAQRTNLLAKS